MPRCSMTLEEFTAGCSMSLEEQYEKACAEPSDINEHLPTLRRLATGLQHVTEFGVRGGVSTTALLAAQPDTLWCYDIAPCDGVFRRLNPVRGRTSFKIFRRDVLTTAKPSKTDMLFIDTLHTYEQLSRELAIHAAGVRRYLAFHDTVTFGKKGENRSGKGIVYAIDEFVKANPEWKPFEAHNNNNGLIVLRKTQ